MAAARARRWLPALPAGCLVLVAGVQIALAHHAQLSPWKGGGFGMFSSLDARPYRFVRIFVEAPERSEELQVPPSLEAQAAAAEIFPTDASMRQLARAVADRERARDRPVETVRIELWRAEYEVATLDPVSRKLRDFAWRAPR